MNEIFYARKYKWILISILYKFEYKNERIDFTLVVEKLEKGSKKESIDDGGSLREYKIGQIELRKRRKRVVYKVICIKKTTDIQRIDNEVINLM